MADRGHHARARRAVLPGFAACIALSGVARADGASERQAQRLFEEAKALANAGNYPPACPKLEQSQQLDPALGTQYNLADCYEHTARFADAHRLFEQVEAIAHAAGKSAREKDAHARVVALDSKVGRLIVKAPAAAGLTGFELRRDGQSMPSAEVGQTTVVDPGEHVVDASAAGKEAWHVSVRIDAGEAKEIEVPPLADVPQLQAAPPQPTTRQTPPKTEGGTGAGALSTQRWIALGSGVLGLAGIATASVFGAISLSDHSSAKDACPQPDPCGDAAAAHKWSDATSAGNVSTIAFVAGGALIGAGAALWFTAPSVKPSMSARLAVSPAFDRGGGSLSIQGAF